MTRTIVLVFPVHRLRANGWRCSNGFRPTACALRPARGTWVASDTEDGAIEDRCVFVRRLDRSVLRMLPLAARHFPSADQ